MIEEDEKLTEIAPDLYEAVVKCQELLAEWIVPDSKTTDKQVLSELLGVLDNTELVRKINTIKYPNHFKMWEDSPNVEYTLFVENLSILEIKFKDNKVYQYLDFTKNCWNELIKAKSIGSFLHREVKGSFRYMRVK